MVSGNDVGGRIRYLREQRDLSLRDLGNDLNMDYSYIGRIERGSIPSIKILNKISDYFNVDLSYLIGEENNLLDESEQPYANWYGFIGEAERKGYSPDDFKKLLHIIDEMKTKGWLINPFLFYIEYQTNVRL